MPTEAGQEGESMWKSLKILWQLSYHLFSTHPHTSLCLLLAQWAAPAWRPSSWARISPICFHRESLFLLSFTCSLDHCSCLLKITEKSALTGLKLSNKEMTVSVSNEKNTRKTFSEDSTHSHLLLVEGTCWSNDQTSACNWEIIRKVSQCQHVTLINTNYSVKIVIRSVI